MSLTERVRPALEVRTQTLEPSAILPKDSELPQNVTGVPRSSGLLSNRELELTEKYDATALVKMLAEGAVTSESLLVAFRKRATIAQQCTNCLTELIPQAINDARACDEFLSKTRQPIGPLHGLPVSVKEQISIAGRRTNIGFVAMVDNFTSEDAQIVTSLKRLGAVVFARTNQPQSLMQLQTDNNIYGATVNPRNRALTAGGSTGGEAALMAMHGTPLGIGGDIGGSIRVPAALNGIYGFYPSIGRISGEGALIPSPGNDSIPGTLGPFTRSLRDISLFCTAYSFAKPWLDDPSLLPVPILSPALGLGQPLHHPTPTNPLRVGILTTDNVVNPLPPVLHALNKVQTRLHQTPNIKLVPFTPFNHEHAWTLISANYFEDGGSAIKSLCKKGDEPLLPATEWILSQCTESMGRIHPDTPQARKAARDAFRLAYSKHWNEAGIDVVIAPVTPGTAPRLDSMTSKVSPYWGYTAVWNLLQYPAIAFPVGELVDDLSADKYQPCNEKEEGIASEYAAGEARGMPVGLQVVAKRLHEAVLLQAAHVIQDALDLDSERGCRL